MLFYPKFSRATNVKSGSGRSGGSRNLAVATLDGTREETVEKRIARRTRHFNGLHLALSHARLSVEVVRDPKASRKPGAWQRQGLAGNTNLGIVQTRNRVEINNVDILCLSAQPLLLLQTKQVSEKNGFGEKRGLPDPVTRARTQSRCRSWSGTHQQCTAGTLESVHMRYLLRATR